MTRPTLSPAGEIVRRHDPDRFFTTLFAPPAQRETLWTLYAFNHELARAREVVREPMAALIRLQWWREVVEGKRPRHEVAVPLGQALDEGRLHAPTLLEMVDAREAETEPILTKEAFEAYVLGTAGALMEAAARALGMAQPAVLREPGAAFGIAGVLLNAPALARQGRSLLPHDMDGDPGEREAALRRQGLLWLDRRPRLPRAVWPAALPLVLARRRLQRPGDRSPARLALTAAALTGRI